MVTHGSATVREDEPHVTDTTTLATSKALKRRAHAVIKDGAIDPRWQTIVRYALETNDPWLADLLRRAETGEKIIDTLDFSLEPKTLEDNCDS